MVLEHVHAAPLFPSIANKRLALAGFAGAISVDWNNPVNQKLAECVVFTPGASWGNAIWRPSEQSRRLEASHGE